MSAIQERYRPQPIAANGTFTLPQGTQALGGFIATADGVLNVYDQFGVNVLVNLAVLAGVYYPLPMFLGNNGRPRVVLSSNAAGTLLLA